MSSAKSTKLITSPTSASSLSDTPQSSQLKFQLPSNIPLSLLPTLTSPYTPTFPSSPTPTAHSWRGANMTACRTSRRMWVNTFEFAGKESSEIVSCRYFFYLFYTTFNLYLVLCIFQGRFLTLCMKTYYRAIIVYHSNFLGKSFPWLWYYCFSHLYYTCLLGIFFE